MSLLALVGVWAAIYVTTTVVAQATTVNCGSSSHADRTVAVVSALLSFFGAVVVGFWDRPRRRARRRHRGGRT